MALTAQEITICRELLDEDKAILFTESELAQRDEGRIRRYWPGIEEQHHDICKEYMRRWGSTLNQAILTVAGITDPVEANGDYYDTGEERYGQPVWLHSSGYSKFIVDISTDTGAYYWKMVRISDGKVLWISSGGSVRLLGVGVHPDPSPLWVVGPDGYLLPVPLSEAPVSITAVSWIAQEVIHEPGPDLEIGVNWEFGPDGVIEPVTGALSMSVKAGIQYHSVTNPKVNFGRVRSGTWRFSGFGIDQDYDGRYRCKGGWAMVQELDLNLVQAAPITESASAWRYVGGPLYDSGSRNVVLELLYVDPASIQSITEENNDSPYDGSIYTVNAGVLEGKWYTVRTVDEIDPATGYGRVLWFLRNHNNEDMIFTHRANPHELRADFFKLNLPSDGIESFKTTYYFDTAGNFYVSTDGVNYTAKNGTAATGTLPADAALLTDTPASRVIASFNASPDDETGEVDIYISLVWFDDHDDKGVIFRGQYGEVSADIELQDVGETRRDAFVNYTYLDASGNWYYCEDVGAGYTAKNGDTTLSGALPADAKKLDEEVEGRQLRVRTTQDRATDQWTVLISARFVSGDVRCGYIDTDERLSYKPSPLASITIDLAYNITKTQLDSAIAHYATTPADGTQRSMSPPRRDAITGLYSFEAIEVASTAVAVAFRIGPEMVYKGYNYPKYPTTDLAAFNADNPEAVGSVPTSDNYYLIGAEWDATLNGGAGGWTCLIDSTSNITQTIDQNEANGTWQWTIRHIAEDSGDSIGPGDLDGNTSFIFEYGDELDFMRYVGRYTQQQITLGAVSLLSYYENVPTNTFGTHSALTNRRKVTPVIRNERVEDGNLSFDLYERVQTPHIQDDDGWYYMGGTESLIRKKEDLANQVIDMMGYGFPRNTLTGVDEGSTIFREILQKDDTDISSADSVGDGKLSLADIIADIAGGGGTYINTTTPILARLQLASKRRRTVHRQRKYFMRRPSESDLDNSAYDGTYSIKEKWDLVKNEQTSGTAPTAEEAITFDIVRVGEQWAVEVMIVRIDDQIYKDGDAFDHFIDSDGNAMLGVSVHVMHNDGTLDAAFTDETEI